MISYFEFNGKKSSDFGIRLYNNLEFISPQKSVEIIDIQGRDGSLYIDNNKREDIKKEIYFDLDVESSPENGSDGQPLFKRVLAINKWLNVKGFKDFKYSMYKGFTFKAMVIDPYNISDTLRTKGRGVIRLIIKPVMYYDDPSISKANPANGGVIDNIGSFNAKPIVTVTTTKADEIIYNNGKKWIVLKNLVVGKPIVIDSESGIVSGGSVHNNSNLAPLTPPYPLLYKGKNKITFSDGTKISMVTRIGEEAI